LELLCRQSGDYQHLYPNQRVNMSQSTNDAYPTALKIALHAEFADVLKMGRTELHDAVPMTLGQEFGSYVATLERDEHSLSQARRVPLFLSYAFCCSHERRRG
jgi:aspartate ammonia-lyase